VAWVLAVNSGTVRVEDYDWDPNNPGACHQHTVNTAGLSFLHFDRATFKNRNSSLYPDVTGPSTDNGALTHHWNWNGADNQ
jgi:hypothetical protein